ncbi:leucyl/phenylalanyl-tRNA--protein transferase [Thalassotalea atypica]|uniref:leucyl/phenylalanyl-tRNA--protein transferase n=1 Tax=Thalassotalea atypica TaxID=2054316 RepID=UPI002572BED6|nr:leucyl/phenylalanyl-tRNA--protein transferase [Thalassotalea atypica]
MTNVNQTLTFLSEESLDFPPVNNALPDPNGLLAVGGDLSPPRILNAYNHGIFPWYSDGEPIMWWSPDPRAIIFTREIKINRTLRKFINRQPYQITLNTAFDQVISLCADAPFRKEDTWIVNEMQLAYQQLHQLGYAHSIEVWLEDELVGGLYGVAINGLFSGESMFYRKANASKFALVAMCQLLAEQNISFIDCQISNEFLQDMGCVSISRNKFISLKQEVLNVELSNQFWHARPLTLK